MTTKLRTLDITYCCAFVALIAVCSWISIPTAVPFTMQTFAVFLTLLMLGGKLGCYAIAVYLLLGAVGVPVFAGFSGGIGTLIGTTGGYLLGFFAITFLYFSMVKNPLQRPMVDIVVLSIGLLLCYSLGTVQFVLIYARDIGEVGVLTALSWCVFPYIIPDFLKLALAFSLAKRLRSHVNL